MHKYVSAFIININKNILLFYIHAYFSYYKVILNQFFNIKVQKNPTQFMQTFFFEK